MKRWIAGVTIALASAACSGSTATSSAAATTTAPTVAVTTEAFSGSVDVGGKTFHAFSVALSGGQVSVNLTAAGPPSTIYMGIGVGVPADGACTILTNGSVITPASATAQLVGTLNAGTYCVVVFDAGNQTASISYSVTVNHF